MNEETIVQPNIAPVKEAYSVEEVAEILGLKLRTAYEFCGNTHEFKVKPLPQREIRAEHYWARLGQNGPRCVWAYAPAAAGYADTAAGIYDVQWPKRGKIFRRHGN